MKNYRGIKADSIPATNTKPVRIKLTDLRYNKTVVLSYGANTPDNQKDRVIQYLETKGIEIQAQTWSEGSQKHTIYLTDNFTNQII